MCFAQNPEIKLYLRRDYLVEVEQKSSAVPQNEHLVLKKARRCAVNTATPYYIYHSVYRRTAINMISVEHLKVEFSARALFSDVSFVVNSAIALRLWAKMAQARARCSKSAGLQTPTDRSRCGTTRRECGIPASSDGTQRRYNLAAEVEKSICAHSRIA